MTDHHAGDVVGSFDPDQLLPGSLWRPRNWRASPHPARPGDPGWIWVILGLLVLYNPVLNLLLPESTHIVANLGFAVLVAVVARKGGATRDNLGLRRDMVGRGLAVGAVVLAAIGVGVVILTAVPATREFFADDRFVAVSPWEMVYEAAVRIPLGTAAVEELLFRGVLLGLLLRRRPVWAAATIAAVLFGFWHVIPAFDAINTNPAGDLVEGPLALAGSVLGTVAFTGLVAFGFTWLRFRGNSLLTPILAHVATNSFGYVAGWLVVSQGWS
jgi:membrane protease YdiL (CAAX protease family)